jgi:lipoprotein-anchoring transpeptidase ErfK/SrfK
MADYYPLLKRAIGSLDRPDERARYDVYDRARKALLHQLEVSGASEADVNLQLEAIGAAVARIENEIAQAAEPPAPVPRSGPPKPPPRRDPQPAQTQFEPSPGAAAMLRRRSIAPIVAAGALIGIVLAGLSYYFVIHRSPAPAPRAETPRQAARPTAPSNPQAVAVDEDNASYMLRRQRIFYRTTHPPGTIIVSRSQRFLYLVQPNQVAIRYAIGTGPECENVAGLFHITEKASLAPKSPAAGTAPPPFRLGEQFGPRAVYFDNTRAVHGTAQPHQIGQSAPAGCFLSWTPDIVDLYDRVQLNDRVVVTN